MKEFGFFALEMKEIGTSLRTKDRLNA